MPLDFSMSDSDELAGPGPVRAVLAEVESLYHRLDAELTHLNAFGPCAACGKCCDFESFGHRLYLTTPEWLYFTHHAAHPLKPMTEGVCPYRIDGKCSVYPFRFAGCRIFQCSGDATAQSDLTEETLAQLKALCQKYAIPYRYLDLKTALSAAPG